MCRHFHSAENLLNQSILGVIQQLRGPNFTRIRTRPPPLPLEWTIVDILHTNYSLFTWTNVDFLLTTTYLPLIVRLVIEWPHSKSLKSTELVMWPISLKFSTQIWLLPPSNQKGRFRIYCFLIGFWLVGQHHQIHGGNFKLIGHVTSWVPCKSSRRSTNAQLSQASCLK